MKKRSSESSTLFSPPKRWCFLIRLRIGYPGFEDEGQMLLNLQRVHPIETIGQVVDGSQLAHLQRRIWEVHIDDTVRNYIVRLVQATRTHPDLALGASPRGSIASRAHTPGNPSSANVGTSRGMARSVR